MITQTAHRTLKPPDALAHQIAKPGNRLFPDHRLLAVANLVACQVEPQGEIDVLGQGIFIPATHLVQGVPAQEQAVSRKRDHAAQYLPRALQGMIEQPVLIVLNAGQQILPGVVKAALTLHAVCPRPGQRCDHAQQEIGCDPRVGITHRNEVATGPCGPQV